MYDPPHEPPALRVREPPIATPSATGAPYVPHVTNDVDTLREGTVETCSGGMQH
jgi:hypothetical protein